jgi:hypothetical protein
MSTGSGKALPRYHYTLLSQNSCPYHIRYPVWLVVLLRIDTPMEDGVGKLGF